MASEVAEIAGWSSSRRKLVSVLVVLHLFAVISSPLASPPASSLSTLVGKPFKWYLHAAYLNHGYRYFNATAGGTTIIRYELVMPDGSTRRERLADRQRHWPRLFYHRHLMLGETMSNALNLPPPQKYQKEMGEMTEFADLLRRKGFFRLAEQQKNEIAEQRADMKERTAQRTRLVHAVAKHLMRQHGAVGIRIYVQKQRLPSPMDIELGHQLGEDSTYQEALMAEFRAEQLGL